MKTRTLSAEDQVEARRVLNFIGSGCAGHNSTVTPAQLDWIMETTGGSILAGGHLLQLHSRRLSPNVWKIWSALS